MLHPDAQSGLSTGRLKVRSPFADDGGGRFVRCGGTG